MTEFRANTLRQAVALAVGRCSKTETKQIPEAYAPPGFWGNWVPVYTQFGITGPGADKHVTKIRVSFRNVVRAKSAFGIEIRGGDNFISTTGPGSEVVTITGNVATEITLRAKSFGPGQAIDITVR